MSKCDPYDPHMKRDLLRREKRTLDHGERDLLRREKRTLDSMKRDLLTLAFHATETGSGKTLAFALPMLQVPQKSPATSKRALLKRPTTSTRTPLKPHTSCGCRKRAYIEHALPARICFTAFALPLLLVPLKSPATRKRALVKRPTESTQGP